MFSFSPDDSGVRPLADEDQQVLHSLVRKYGVSSLVCALTGAGESSRASTFSATTLLSSTGTTASAPSLWSEPSQGRSDAASISTQSTWPDTLPGDVPSIHEPELTNTAKIPDRTWLDSPGAVPSPLPAQDVTSNPSPRPVVATNKKYQCPSCYTDHNAVGFGRKSDFKKHLHNFHGADVIWICKTKGCHLSYTTERAYSTHAKETHRMDALPNSAAKTELCPQVVFSCGFASCKDRVFEAQTKDDSSATRDKYFEHIAKHFEDGFDVNDWEYRVQVQNLMRQQRVKPIWKTCIWPKEKRQQLVWRPRSSGDLKRMLECRHLGEDISTLVRLAFILGTAPFTSSRTPPPSEIDLHFQLPFRSQCLMDAVGHPGNTPTNMGSSSSSTPPGSAKSEDAPTFSTSKRTTIQQSMFDKLPSRRVKRESRPPTPASGSGMSAMSDTIMRDDPAAGPHPGTPFPIPNETYLPVDAPKFAPDANALPKQMNTPVDTPVDTPTMGFQMPNHDDLQQQYHYQQQHQQHHQQDQIWAGMDMDPMIPYGADATLGNGGDFYEVAMSTSQASTVRPATPVPNKRPASWSKIMSLEALRPKKKHGTPGSELDEPIPAMPAMPAGMYHHVQHHDGMPTSMPMSHGYDLPMRMGHEPQHHPRSQPQQHHHHQHPQQQGFGEPMQMNSPTTFFFDDEVRL